MIRRPQLSAVIAIAALSLGSANVFAQSGATARLYCHAVGASTPEPLGDREGHAIAVSEIPGALKAAPPTAVFLLAAYVQSARPKRLQAHRGRPGSAAGGPTPPFRPR